MQEIVQGKRNYHVVFGYDEELIKRVAGNCGSESVKSAPSYTSALRYWSKNKFFCFTVDGVAFCCGSFAKKHFRLAEIAVEKGSQSKGYGRFMLSVLQAECYKRKVNKITFRTAINETAYNWYVKKGAQVVGITGNDYEMEFVL